MKLGAYNITVTVDDEPLEEFKVEVKGRTTECWIASEEGKTFAIEIEQNAGWTSFDTSADVFLDGHKRASACPIIDNFISSRTVLGVQISASELRRFVFSPLITTDEGPINAKAVRDDFGTISVRLWRGTKTVPANRTSRTYVPDTASRLHEVAVKKRKVSHVCGTGDRISFDSPGYQFNYHDPEDKPLHVFKFKYRTESLLQAMEIIEMSPAPPCPPRRIRNASAGPSRSRSDPIDPSDDDSDDADDEAVERAQAAQERAQAAQERAQAAQERAQADQERAQADRERAQAALDEARKQAAAKKALRKSNSRADLEDRKPTLATLFAAVGKGKGKGKREVIEISDSESD